MKTEPSSLDYFAGGVPAGAIFQLNASQIRKVLQAKSKGLIGNTLEEACFIGLVAYFEAFCHDCFASLINICPDLLRRLKAKSVDISVDSLAALGMNEAFAYNIGFLVCERFDFGTARKINAMYASLLDITPFSKDEAIVYDEILADRNLLVHHGGVYTHSYWVQRLGITASAARPFVDSLKVDLEYVRGRFNFLNALAQKIVNASHNAVTQQLGNGNLAIAGAAKSGLAMFNWLDEDMSKPW